MVVLDEIQTKPELFPVLRVLLDRPDSPARFLLLGSASPSLIRGAGETLAGRVEFVDLHGFDLTEVKLPWTSLWSRGGFPRSLLAANEADSHAWREGFIRTFLQRDLPQYGVQVSESTLRRFWTLLAHSHGQLLNSSGLGRALGSSDKTIRSYIDVLESTFMLRTLPPWHENLKKRQVKAPKIYLRDSGLLHALLGIETENQLLSHPIQGASWEGFVLEQLLRVHVFPQAYFWSTHAGAELDMLVFHKGQRLGFEFKFSERPATTRSMHVAREDLKLDHLYVIHPGQGRAPLQEGITALGIAESIRPGIFDQSA